MRQQSRRIRIKAFFYLFIFAATVFALNSLFITKKADGKSSLLAASLSATKTAALDTTAGGDINGNNVINPGDRLTYTITIPNGGPDAATGVSLSDTIDANTTFVSGSVIAAPVAVNDAYSSIGNVGISVPDGTSDLLANDLDANNVGTNAALTFTQINGAAFADGSAVATANGSVKVFANGSFNYTPNLGFEGTDTFTYTLSNNTTLTDTANVNITVSGMIWFVKNDATACTTIADGCGRVGNPFSSLAAFQSFNIGSGNNPAANDNIFIYTGNASYDGSLTLLDGQKLIGQGANSVLAGAGSITGISIPTFSNALPSTGGTSPTIITTAVSPATNAVNLGSNNTIRGVTIGNTTGAKLNASASVGTLTVGATSGTSDVTLNSNGQALNLTGGGTLAARFASISSTNANQTAAATGITLTNVGGSLVSPTTTITNPNGIGINVSGSAAGATFDFGVTTANQSGATALSLSNNAGAITFAALNIAPDAGQRGILATSNTGTITSTSGTVTNITNVPAVEITGASAASLTPLNLQFTSVSANGGANGIALTNTSSAGSPGGFTVNGTGTTAGSGGTIQNITARGASFITTANITLKNMNFVSANTVDLGDTTSPTYTTGTCGTVLSGGTNTGCSAPIHFNTVGGATLSNIALTGTMTQNGINGYKVTNLSMSNIDLGGIGDESNEDAINLQEVSGTLTLSSVNSHNNRNRNLSIVQRTASATFTAASSKFNNSTNEQGAIIEAGTTGALTASFTSCEFKNNLSYGFNATVSSGASPSLNVTIANSTLTGNTAAGGMILQASGGNLDYAITNNIINSNNISIGLNASSSGTIGATSSIISSNTLGLLGVQNSCSASGSECIALEALNSGRLKTTITGNTIQGIGTNGIGHRARNTTKTNLTITGNTFLNPNAGSVSAIWLDLGIQGTSGNSSCTVATIGGSTAALKNNIPGTWGGGVPIAVLNGNSNFGTLNLPGLVGNTPAAAQTFLNNNNTLQASAYADGTGTYGGGSTCPGGIAQNFNFYNNRQSELAAFKNDSIVERSEICQTTQTNIFDNPVGAKYSFGIFQNPQSTILNVEEAVAANTNSITEADLNKTKVHFSEKINEEIVYHSAEVSASFFNAANSFANLIEKISSVITPNVSAQESEKTNAILSAPQSGETVSKTLGTLPPNEQIVVRFKATVNTTPANFYSVSNQGTVSATGLSNILTDDPAVTGAANPTVTQIVQPLTISKAFGASSISLNATTTLTFTITNSNPSASAAGVAFTDNLPLGLLVAATPGVVNNCANGTVTAAAGASSISYTGGTRPANTSCTIVVNVRGTAEGAQNNTTGAIASTEGGTGLTSNTATITIINPPTLAMSFTPNQIQLNATSALQFTLANPNATLALNTLAFTDSLPAGINAPNTAAATVCTDGSYSITNNVISFTKPTLAAGTNCVFSVTVTGTTAGLKTNLTSAVTTANSNSGTAATANLTVVAPPTITKDFSPTSIVSGGTSTVTLTLSNSNTTGALTNASFTDSLVNMTAAGGAAGGTCTGTSSNNFAAGATALSFGGITIPNNGSCTVIFSVTSSTVGTQPNTTSGVTTAQTATAGTPSNTATLTVNAPADVVLTKTHAGNFTQGDTAKTYSITVTNSGGTPTSGIVTVTDTLPTGLTATAVSGAGWSCVLATLTCTRSDALAALGNYPAITLTVNVANNAPASLTNTATVSGGGETNAANNTASDPTTISAAPTYTISGQVTNGGEGLSGVSIALSGSSTVSVTTNSSGTYSFANLSAGNYTITPTLNGYTFVQPSITVNNLSSNQINQNFSTSIVTYEGDVAARPTGDETVDIFDLILTGNIIANQPGVTAFANGGEYQRADAAPRSSKGDGSVDVQDLIQMGLYAAANSPLTPAGGPTVAAPPAMPVAVASKADTDQTGADGIDIDPLNTFINQPDAVAAGSAAVSAGSVNSSAGSTAIIPIQLNSTNVGGVQFTVTYESAKLSIPSLAAVTDQAAGTSFTFNNSTPGQLGVIAFRSTAGTAFPASTLLFNINFTVKAGAPAGASAIGFGITPVPIKASDPAAEAATIGTTSGAVTIVGSTAATVRVSGRVITASGARGISGVRLSLTDSQGNVRETVSGKSGYYRFDDVEVGSSYVITATGKRYFFSQPSQMLNINEETEEVNFIAHPIKRFVL